MIYFEPLQLRTPDATWHFHMWHSLMAWLGERWCSGSYENQLVFANIYIYIIGGDKYTVDHCDGGGNGCGISSRWLTPQ